MAAFALVIAGCTSINADARTFENSRWRVTAINGQPTPATGDYRVEFQGGRIGGRFGCNHFGGPYSIRGDVIVAGEIASTLIGCPEPAATHEAQAFGVLRQPMRMSWSSGTQLTLGNANGSIQLERVP